MSSTSSSRATRLRVGVLAILGALLGLVALPAHAATSDDGVPGPVLLLGTTGVQWEDVGPETTPHLWALGQDASVGNLVVRSVISFTCPSEGWLAVSAGNRAGDTENPDLSSCRTLEEPADGAAVPGWDDYSTLAADSNFAPQLGTLGEAVASKGLAATSVGPGAAIALMDADGVPVGEHVVAPPADEAFGEAVGEALATSDLVVADAGSFREPGFPLIPRGEDDVPADEDDDPEPQAGPDEPDLDDRAADLTALDARIGAVLDAAADARADGLDPTILVASVADASRSPRMQVLAASGPAADGSYGESLLTSQSTRQVGYTQTTDLLPTLRGLLDLTLPDGVAVGSPVTPTDGPDTGTARMDNLVDQGVHAVAIRPLVGPFYAIFVVVNLLLYAGVTVGLSRRVLSRVGETPASDAQPGDDTFVGRLARRMRAHPSGVLRAMQAAAVAVAALPVSTYLANLTPWWRVSGAGWALTGLVVAWVAVITVIVIAPVWQRWLLGPLGAVAALTAAVIALDVATGARLQISSLMGVQPMVAGRFYGFNNTAFALFATSTILFAVAVANPLVLRGRRGLAALCVAVIGLVAVVLDGLPSIGADFGGPPALVPAFALLTLFAGGVRITWRRVLGILVAAVVVVSSFAVVDWLRPPDDRTHLGRFVQTVIDGGLWDVVARKLEQNLQILFGNALTLVAIAGILLVVLVLGKPLRLAATQPDGGAYKWLSNGTPLTQLGQDAPMLRPGLISLTVALGIGFAVNDSGVVIPATGIAIAVPLLVAVYVNWLRVVRNRATADEARAGQAETDEPGEVSRGR
ncbi:hypothetical protein [Paraoerskovia marina]|uniref:hypothetical protein n=1 Tax=Paraoerskovia marina TaxID=545619 RepID=UPI0012DBD04B|nr:hypothetical protein [Paraoerskovia marina]